MVKRFILLFLFIFSYTSFSQNDNFKLGSPPSRVNQNYGASYDCSDPTGMNIKVSIWGFIKFPGKYLVPQNSTVSDILSFGGGPSPDAYLDDIRLLRTLPDSTQEIYKFDYNELMFEKTVTSKQFKDMIVQPGDILVLPGEPRLYFRDYLNLSINIVATLVSLSILILNIARK